MPYNEIIITILIRTYISQGEKKAIWKPKNEKGSHSFNYTFESNKGAMQSCDKCNTSEKVFPKVFWQIY